MDLEVEVRATGRVTRVTHEPEHLSGVHPLSVDRERRIRGQMGVVELVPEPVAQPHLPTAEIVPADAEDRAVRDCEDGGAERAEDVLAVVPPAADGRAWGAKRVTERGRAEDREHVASVRETRGHLGRGPDELGRLAGHGRPRLLRRAGRPLSAGSAGPASAEASVWASHRVYRPTSPASARADTEPTEITVPAGARRDRRRG